MQYTVKTLQRQGGKAVVLDTIGPFFYEAGACTVARTESRKYTSQTIYVVVECEGSKRGFPKAFRMGQPTKL